MAIDTYHDAISDYTISTTINNFWFYNLLFFDFITSDRPDSEPYIDDL